MIKEGNFGLREAISLTSTVLIAKAFFTSVAVVIKLGGTASWILTILSYLFSMVAFSLIYLLMKRFPGKDLTAIFNEVCGKIVGRILSILFCLYFIYYAGSNLREFVEMIKAFNLPYTPPSLITFVFLLAVIVMAYLGLETLARVANASFYYILLGIAIILLFSIPNYDIDNMFPIAGYGIGKTLSQGILRSSAYDEVILLAFIINSIHGLKNFKKAGYISLTIAVVTITLTIYCSLLAFEYPMAGENLSSLFQLTRVIYISRFLQRIEAIFLFIWVVSSIITVAAGFYLSISIYCKAFNIENHRPLILPFSFLTFMVSLQPQSLSEVSYRNIVGIREYSLFLVFLLPVLVLIIAVILGKKGGDDTHEKA